METHLSEVLKEDGRSLSSQDWRMACHHVEAFLRKIQTSKIVDINDIDKAARYLKCQ